MRNSIKETIFVVSAMYLVAGPTFIIMGLVYYIPLAVVVSILYVLAIIGYIKNLT